MPSIENPPPGMGTPPPGLMDQSLPGQENPVAGEGPAMLTQMWAEFNKAIQGGSDTAGLATLQQVTDTILAKGYATKADLTSFEAAVAAASPSLPAPAQALLDAFGFEMKSILQPPGTDVNIPIGGGNKFLNCSATLALFKLTSEIISIMSKIQLMENLKSVQLSKVQLGMAVMAAEATKLAGLIESEKETEQAKQFGIAAALDMAQVATTIVTATVQSVMTKRETNDILKKKAVDAVEDKSIDPTRLTASEKIQIDRTVQEKMTIWSSGTSGLFSAAKNMTQEELHFALATLDIQAAAQNALGQLLNKLVDLIGQTASMLSKSADSDAGGVINSQLQLFKTWIEAAAQMWRSA